MNNVPPSGPLVATENNWIIDSDSLDVFVIIASGEFQWMATLTCNNSTFQRDHLQIDRYQGRSWYIVWDSDVFLPSNSDNVYWDDDYALIDEAQQTEEEISQYNNGREDTRQINQLFFQMEKDFAGVVTNLLTLNQL